MHAYRYERLVQWGDCDPAGIIYFPNYLRWVADGLTALFLDLGVDPTDSKDRDTITGLPSVNCSLSFHSPARYHDRITHEIRIARLGTKSLDVAHRFSRADACLAEAQERRVWAEMNIRDGKLTAVPIPGDIRTMLEGNRSH